MSDTGPFGGERPAIRVIGTPWALRLALAVGVIIASLVLLIVLVPAAALALAAFFVASAILAVRDLGKRALTRDGRENCRVREP
ncbi:MAG: hypothetical protein IT437_06175 [Phycisphaerales bacterium]|nr:hypothetical protein [Phycisphaerales bacterium]